MDNKDFQDFLREQISQINTNLNNHVNELTGKINIIEKSVGKIEVDVSWLKDFRLKDIEKKYEVKDKIIEEKESKDDIKTQESSRWLEKGFWWLVATLITGFTFTIGLILQHILSDK
jgi:hypothetical protein